MVSGGWLLVRKAEGWRVHALAINFETPAHPTTNHDFGRFGFPLYSESGIAQGAPRARLDDVTTNRPRCLCDDGTRAIRDGVPRTNRRPAVSWPRRGHDAERSPVWSRRET
jgi:hypothetical protein